MTPSIDPNWFPQINQLIASGQKEDAHKLLSEVIKQENKNAYICNLLGLVTASLEDTVSAQKFYRDGIKLDSQFLPLYSNLGNLLAQQGRLVEAVAIYQQGMECPGIKTELLINLGLTLSYLGKNDDAIQALSKAISLNPDFLEAHLNLGLVYMSQGRYPEAGAEFHKVISINPNHPGAHNGLGLVSHQQGYITSAEAAYRKALQLSPNDPKSKINLANILLEGSLQAEAISVLKDVMNNTPQKDACSNLLMCMQYDSDISASQMFEWAKKLNLPNEKVFQFNRDYQNNKFLKEEKAVLGFVSADLRAHPVGWFLKSILPLLKINYKIIIYANQSAEDFITKELKVHSDDWIQILGISDFQAAERIRSDGVDILFDLSGHTSGNRLGIFSLRAAPVQVSWLGYFATTGLPEMDYCLMDKEHVPPGSEKNFSEKLVYLDPIRLCYSPPAYAPIPSPPPVLLNKYITFGSFNNSSKLNLFTVKLWSNLLNELPDSRLILKWKTFIDLGMRARVRGMFMNHGVAPGRIQFSSLSTHDVMLAEYSEIDIALDTYPFTGATTTCEALWMGVPVITLRGDRPVSRQSSAMLKTLGLDELIADSSEEYVQSASKLSKDVKKLAYLREKFRGMLSASPLCDPQIFTDSLIKAIEEMRKNYTS
jgi:protein O-GlcNAc transferase